MKLVALFCALLALNNFELVSSARILGVFPYLSKSHTILVQPIFIELAKRGHEVTFLSPFPMKNPPKNYRDVALTNPKMFEIYEREMSQMFNNIDMNPFTMLRDMFVENAENVRSILEDVAVQKLLKSKDERFDLVFIDTLINEALLGMYFVFIGISLSFSNNHSSTAFNFKGFGPHFNAKIIGISTFGSIRYVNDMMHNPYPLSVIPHPMLPHLDHMTLLQRLENIIFHAMEGLIIQLYHYPLQVCLCCRFHCLFFHKVCLLINLITSCHHRDIASNLR